DRGKHVPVAGTPLLVAAFAPDLKMVRAAANHLDEGRLFGLESNQHPRPISLFLPPMNDAQPSPDAATPKPESPCAWWEVEPGGLSETARRRRDEIMDAAEAIIAEAGIDELSLAKIEQRAGMSRGQLTYYFPTRESILLAVYDRMLRRMIRAFLAGEG